jgi:hypothetical protein
MTPLRAVLCPGIPVNEPIGVPSRSDAVIQDARPQGPEGRDCVTRLAGSQ